MGNHFQYMHQHQHLHAHHSAQEHASHHHESKSLHHPMLNEYHLHAVHHVHNGTHEDNIAALTPLATIDFQNQNIYAAAKGKDVPVVSVDDNDDPQIKAIGQTLADYAVDEALSIHTVGDCARGPRRTFERVGLHFPVVYATEQGAVVQNSGLFDEVPRALVRPGDYGVRDWNSLVTKAHNGINKGDAFIVTKVDSSGRLYGANDHLDWVPEDGDRYRNMHFYRLNHRFMHLRNYLMPVEPSTENDA